jgi:hypothetical protein
MASTGHWGALALCICAKAGVSTDHLIGASGAGALRGREGTKKISPCAMPQQQPEHETSMYSIDRTWIFTRHGYMQHTINKS